MTLSVINRLSRVVVAGSLGLVLIHSAALALTIELNYKERKSEPPEYDPGGEELQHIMEVAARYWESAFPDISKTIRINYYWKKWDKDRDKIDHIADAAEVNPLRNLHRIRFFTFDHFKNSIPWFIDESPRDPSDISILGYKQELVYDNSDGISWAPHLMEVSYSVDNHSIIENDLYTTALHEIGHTLGLGHSWPCGTYISVDPVFSNRFLSSIPVGIHIDRVLRSGFLGIRYSHHIKPMTTMCSDRDDVRYLPSATDILAVAGENGWTEVNLPRKEMMYRPSTSTTLYWGNWENWFGDRIPDIKSIAYVRDSRIAEVIIEKDAEARALYIDKFPPPTKSSNDLKVILIKNKTLDIEDGLEIEFPGDGIGSTEFHMEDGSTIKAENMIIRSASIILDHGATIDVREKITVKNNYGGPSVYGELMVGSGVYQDNPAKLVNRNGELDLSYGQLRLYHGKILCGDVCVESKSYIRGMGSFHELKHLDNSGSIIAENGDITFNSPGDVATLDLDGDHDSKTALLSALDGSIELYGEVKDAFQGVMQIGHYNTIKLQSTLCVTDPGRIELSLEKATVEAPSLILEQGGFVQVSSDEAVIDSKIILNSPSSIQVASDKDLYLMGDIVYNGGEISGQGTAHQVADAIVKSHTAIFVDIYNWDGQSPLYSKKPSDTVIEKGVCLALYGWFLSTSPSTDGHDGQIIMKDGANLFLMPDLRIDNLLTLKNGHIAGIGTITNYGIVRGSGVIEVEFINHGTVIGEDPGLYFTYGCTNHTGSTVSGTVRGCP